MTVYKTYRLLDVDCTSYTSLELFPLLGALILLLLLLRKAKLPHFLPA